MNKSIFIKPILISSIIFMIGAFFLFPESSYTLFINKVCDNIFDTFSYLGYGLLFSIFFIALPLIIFVTLSKLLLMVTGRNLDRWSPQEYISLEIHFI
jgi:hypothetical protein